VRVSSPRTPVGAALFVMAGSSQTRLWRLATEEGPLPGG
jgi:hypothetical protein